MRRVVSTIAWLAVVSLGAACGDNVDEDNQILNPPRDVYEEWIKIEPPGVVCGNNTPYKMFANFSAKSDNLVVVLEPGGACWDYPSCTGADGIRGAANIDGIPDDHWELAQFISPFLSRFDDTNPSKDWNMIYVPYCTADVHTGNTTVVYSDGTDPDVTFHHDGHAVIQAAVSYLDGQFTHVPKLLVTGCSAGGVGSVVNYRFFRNGITAAKQGYLLDDSGPIFPTASYSGPLHAMIRAAWNLDSIADTMPPGFTLDDMGTINTTLADEFPNDRLATTFFRRDYNFSLYSYERFYNFPPKEEIMRMWDSDTQLFAGLYDTRPNLRYYLPYWRNFNSSHCTTAATFAGSEIQDHDMTLEQWVSDFVNDKPVESMMEAPVPGEDVE